jgi:hypothetical protein
MSQVHKVGLSQYQINNWVEALESGKYEQGIHRLCKDDRYCCLGVLAEVGFGCQWVTVEGFDGQMPVHGQQFYAIETGYLLPEHLPKELQTVLSSMNDGVAYVADKPYNFREIAGWIKEHVRPEGYE